MGAGTEEGQSEHVKVLRFFENLSKLSLEVLLDEVEEDLVGPVSLGKGSAAEVYEMATHEKEAVTREKISVDGIFFRRQLLASTTAPVLSLLEKGDLGSRKSPGLIVRELLQVEGESKFALFTIGVRLEDGTSLVSSKVGVRGDSIVGNCVADKIDQGVVKEASTAVVVGDVTIGLSITVLEL